MGILQRLLKGNEDKAEFRQRFKQAQEDDRIINLIEERKKSSNKRELERYYREQEEAKIKAALDQIHHKNNAEMWKSKHGVLDKGTSILKDDRPILKEKNIFVNNPNIFSNGNTMGFFK